jgi:Zn ribbon nucleic-acid-binding protein
VDKKKTRTWASEHRKNFSMVMFANERRVANINARDISILVLPDSEEKTIKKEETKAEGPKVEAEETCEEELPDNPPCAEEDEPKEDGWLCPQCLESPSQFLQWQEELERIVDCMNPDLSNKQKRYELYQHVTRHRHGTLGKSNRKPLPSCFEQGMRDLYPSSEKYTGYQTAYNSGPDDGFTPVYK